MYDVSQVLQTLMNTFTGLVSFLSTPIGVAIENAINIDLPNWTFFDITIIETILGGGILTYMGYALVSWIIDILP